MFLMFFKWWSIFQTKLVILAIKLQFQHVLTVVENVMSEWTSV